MPTVEFHERVFGPGPGDKNTVFKCSGRRFRKGQIAYLTDEEFDILKRDINPKNFSVVGDDTPLRAREPDAVSFEEAQRHERTLAEVDPIRDALNTEARHLARKMTPEVAAQMGVSQPEPQPEAEPVKQSKPRKKVSRDTGAKKKDVRALRAEILGG